jgi:predicted  nucleic acid-binding Zn-ribbon protein
MAGLGLAQMFADRRRQGEATRENIIREIDCNLKRLDAAEYEPDGELREKLEELKSALGGDARCENSAKPVFEELNALSLRVRAVELDEAQLRSRVQSIREHIETARAFQDDAAAGKLDGFEDELERARSLPKEERMAELQGISDRISEMQKNAPRVGVSESVFFENSIEDEKKEINRMILEIRDWADRISGIDETEGERVSEALKGLSPATKFPGRIASLHRQFRAEWGALRERASSTSFFRDTLTELKLDLSGPGAATGSEAGKKLLARCDTICGGKYIERADFMKLYEDIAKFVSENAESIADSIFAGKVERALAELGYEILPDEHAETRAAAEALAPGSVRYLESPYEGYRVMVKTDKRGTVATRLVRAEGEGAENRSGPDQEAADREAGKKWCRDFDGFLEKMSEIGLPLDVSVRKEPGEAEVLAVTDKKAGARKPKRKKSRAKGPARDMMLLERKDADI